MKKFLFSLVAVAALMTACNKAEAPSISTDIEELSVTTDGGVFDVKVKANVPTRTEIAYEDGSDWIFLMPKVLKGDGTLNFTISKFLDYDAVRKATATITGDGVTKVITITQTGRPKPEVTELDLDVCNVYSDVEGGSYEISVSTAGDWTASVDGDAAWCTVENGSGFGVGKFVIKVAESTDYQYRTADVKVVSGQLERIVHVQHVGTKIGELVWANANVDEPDTFGKNCQVRGKLYQWNSKVGYPTYSANDHGDPEKVVPGFETGQKDSMSETWTEENDPCPDGWRVPSWDEVKTLIGAELSTPTFWFDYWMTNGMSVAGAYVGLDRELMKTECRPEHLGGAIFIPQAGMISRDSGKQENWWSVVLWTSTNVGQTWDMHGIWMDGNNNCGFTDWYGSMSGLSVRCVLK